MCIQVRYSDRKFDEKSNELNPLSNAELPHSVWECSNFVAIFSNKNELLITNLVPGAFSLFDIVDRRNPWPRLPKWLQKFVRISSRKHDEMSSFLQKTNRLHTLETTSEKALSSCVTWQNTTRFLEYFSSLDQGFLRSAILNQEEALRTRLINNVSIEWQLSSSYIKINWLQWPGLMPPAQFLQICSKAKSIVQWGHGILDSFHDAFCVTIQSAGVLKL